MLRLMKLLFVQSSLKCLKNFALLSAACCLCAEARYQTMGKACLGDTIRMSTERQAHVSGVCVPYTAFLHGL